MLPNPIAAATNAQTGILYLIPTVLAAGTEMQSLSPQIKDVVTHTDYYLVENLRTARRFISSLKTGKVIENLTFFVLDKNTRPEALKEAMQILQNGKNVGIISEAGCPGIADPGAVAVSLAHKLQIKVVPLTGPSSILLALMASGFNGQSFTFNGYLPLDKNDRSQAIKKLEKEALQLKRTQIFIETPYRNNKLLEDLLKTCMPDTQICVAANLTASDELIISQPIKNWRKKPLPDLNKIPAIFLLFTE